jgi:hypothetical protein
MAGPPTLSQHIGVRIPFLPTNFNPVSFIVGRDHHCPAADVLVGL